MIKNPVLETYSRNLQFTYASLRKGLASIADWTPSSTTPAEFSHARRVEAAMCGQRVGACGKAARRDHLIAGLLAERAAGVDITPTVALHVIEKILGKGSDWRVLLQAFAESKRTAARKSDASIDEIAARAGVGIDDFVEEMRSIYKKERSEHLLTLAKEKRS